MHIHSKIHTVSPRKGHSCASVQIAVTKHKHSPQRNLTTQKISLFQNKFTLKVSFKIHSCQAYSNISLFRISITCKFLSLGEVGIPKQKPGVSPHWKSTGAKSNFNWKMQRARGQQERNPASQGAVPWDVGRGPGDAPLSLSSVLREQHREHGSDGCRGSTSGTQLSQEHAAARYSWLWPRLVNLQHHII